MKIQGYNISMIRGDTETIKVSCKDAQGVDVPLKDGDTLYFTVAALGNGTDVARAYRGELPAKAPSWHLMRWS
jgi:hypothetical protein